MSEKIKVSLLTVRHARYLDSIPFKPADVDEAIAALIDGRAVVVDARELELLRDDTDIALASHRKDVIEECAKVCDDASSDSEMRVYGKYFAAAIRALKEREAGA